MKTPIRATASLALAGIMLAGSAVAAPAADAYFVRPWSPVQAASNATKTYNAVNGWCLANPFPCGIAVSTGIGILLGPARN